MADPQVVTQYQTTIPEYARRYVEDLLGVGAGTVYQYKTEPVLDAQGKPVIGADGKQVTKVVTDAKGMPVISGFQPYQQYTGERFAQFTPLQRQAMEAAGQLRVPGQMYDASQIAKLAAERAGGTTYTPYNYQAAQVSVDPSRFVPPEMRAAQAAFSPNLQTYQMGPAERVAARPDIQSRNIQAAQAAYNPALQTYQMGPAQQVSTRSFAAPGATQSYMSPYMQNVVDIEKREAQRQADIARTGRGAQFAKAGAFGGARQAIEEAEARRNLATQMGDIQSRGLQSAYQQAQQQFNAEQQAQLEAERANQAAGLTVGQQNLAAQLGVQQLGAGQIGLQTALANLNAQQQANVQNEANYLQAQGMSSDQALRTAFANQQSGLTVGQQNLAAQLGVQQLGTQTGLQSLLANLSNEQQAAVQNQASRLQTQGLSSSQALQAALANQQAYQQAANLSEQSRQYGAGLGLQGLQTALTGAGQLGNLGQNIWSQNQGNLNMQNLFGGQQQQQMQNMLNANYQDFLNAQNQPYRQLGFMSDLLRGTQGLGQSSIYQYQQPQSTIGQLAGLGTAAAGFGRLFAEGGSVTSDEAVESYLDDLSDQQLAQARQTAIAKQDMARLQLIEQELAQRASLRRGMGSAFNALPQQTQQQVVSAAEGGVMRFADEGLVPSAVSPEFGGTQPMTQTEMLRDEDRRQALLAQRAEDARYNALVEGRKTSPAQPATQTRPASPAASAPRFEQADMRKFDAAKAQIDDAKAKPDPKLTRSEKSAATKVAAAVASQTQGNRSDLISDYQRLFAQFKNEDNEALKGIRDAIGKMNKLPEYDRNDAMVKFGLAMAQAASRPGANLLSSISAAAPEIVAHKEKYETEKRAMDRLNAQLQIEQAKYEMALRKDDRTAAMNIAGKMQDIQLQKDRLASEERRHRESMGRSQTGLMGIYEQLRKEDPNASAESLLRKSADIANTGVSMRTEAGRDVKLAEGLRKIDEQFKMLPALKAGNPNSPMVAQMEVQRQQMIRDLYGTLGGGQPSGVTSPPAQSYTGFKMLGVQPSQ